MAVRWFSRLPFSQSDPLGTTGFSNLGCFFGVEGGTRVWQTLGGGQSVAVRLSSRLPFSQSDFVFPIIPKTSFFFYEIFFLVKTADLVAVGLPSELF